MAIYHCSIKPISRGAGQSIIAAAAYRHTCKLENSQTGEVYDYSRKRGLEFSGIYLPSGINPSWAQDRKQLWNAAEAAEKRKNACLGREIVLALPDELSAENRRELTEEMARYLADRYGLVVDVAIHRPNHHGDHRNHHAHLLVSSRRIRPEGFGEKARELDDMKVRGPVEVEQIREEWARLANRALEKAGQQITIDHRSFQRQGVNRIPTLHLGASANALERRGIQTRIGDRNRSAQVFNAKVKAVGELERPRHDPVPEKTQPRPRSLSEIRMGMAAFVGNFASHKKNVEEAERRKKERRQQEEKRRQEAFARVMAMKKRVPEDRLSSNVDMAYAGYFSAWRQETAPPPWTADTLRQADAYIAARLIAEGRDLTKITAALEKHSPAAALLTEAAYAENLVARTAERPDVQEQRKEAQEREQERERQRQEQKKRRSMSLGR